MSKEEQTINTQFALRELSMMFSSPAFGLNESKATLGRHRLNDSYSSENCVETSLEVETNPNDSFAQQQPTNVGEGDDMERDRLKSGFQIFEDC